MTMWFKFTDQDGGLWTIQQDNNQPLGGARGGRPQWVCRKGDHDFGALLNGKTPGEVVDAIVGFVHNMHSTKTETVARRFSLSREEVSAIVEDAIRAAPDGDVLNAR
jgi:hypothetical protein